MVKSRPMIGITPGYNFDKSMAYVKDGYYEAIIEAGGLPMLLPLSTDEELLGLIINSCDGFLITGGPDMDAKHYGELNLPFNEEISPLRDVMELFLIRGAIEINKPIFAICRGIQVLNVAQGGTLYQDINAQIKDRETIKHSQNAPKWYPTHEIELEKGSRVGEAFKDRRINVNSFHHQAVKDISSDFKVTARAQDGVIEAIEHVSQRFAVGVQWHPELMWKANRVFLKLFEAFVSSCK